MTDLFLLSEARPERIERFFPLSHGIFRVDGRRIVSAIVLVIKNGLRRRAAPRGYGPHKTIYNRFVRWSRLGVFNKIFTELARKGGRPERVMPAWPELHAAREPRRPGSPSIPRLSEGRMSDYKGAAPMLAALPKAKELLGDKGHDADWAYPRASRPSPIVKSKSAMIACSKDSATKSRTCSDGSRRLAPRPRALRPMRARLHVRHPHRRRLHLLVVINESRT